MVEPALEAILRSWTRVMLGVVLTFGTAACAGGPGGDAQDESEPAFPGVGGGGGTLTFDGETIPIASATCVLADDTFDVGTVSDNQVRVFVSQNNPLNPVSVQILDADSVQWFPQGVSGDEAERNGGTFTSPEQTYFNNTNDRTVTASFTIECS